MPILDAAADLDALRSFLRKEPVLNSVPLGIVSRALLDPAQRTELFAAVVERDGEVVAAALRSDLPKAVLAAGGSDEQVVELARLVHSAMPNLPCAFGPSGLSTTFAAEWRNLTGKTSLEGVPQRIHILRGAPRAADVAGVMRAATAIDHELVVEWFLAFEEDALADQRRPAAAVSDAVNRNIAEGSVFLWVDEVPVSLAGAREFGEGVARVGPVYTSPRFRRRGYAGAVTTAASRQMLDNGCSACCLFTDLRNPTSNHIYAEVGYEAVVDFREFWFQVP